MAVRPPEPPSSGPTQGDVENAAAWDKLASSSSDSVAASAEKWRDGLGALVTLITGGLIIAGPDGADMPPEWRFTAAIVTMIGIGCAAVGCFIALNVSAGRPNLADLPSVVAKYRSVENYTAIRAASNVGSVNAVRILAMCSVAILILGAGIWSVAPKVETDTPELSVEVGEDTYCGELLSADDQVIVLKIDGESDPRPLPYDEVLNFRQVNTC